MCYCQGDSHPSTGRSMGIFKSRKFVSRGGFTLIELLVVIAIISLLVSILLPSLQKAKGLAQEVVCASNQKGIGILIGFYLNDYDDKYFVHYNGGNPGGIGVNAYYNLMFWWSMLDFFYEKNGDGGNDAMLDSCYQDRVSKIFACPSAEPPAYGWSTGNWLQTETVSYGLQYDWLTEKDGTGIPIKGKGLNSSSIKTPQETVVIADIETRPVGYWIIYRPAFGRLMHGTSYINDWGAAGWHREGLNVLWADSHVTHMSEAELYNDGDDKYFDLE